MFEIVKKIFSLMAFDSFKNVVIVLQLLNQ